MKKRKFKKRLLIFTIVSFLATIFFILPKTTTIQELVPTFAVPPRIIFPTEEKNNSIKPLLNLPDPDIQRMKNQGCIADGFLNGYEKGSGDVNVVNGSNCYYLHRSLETWLEAPDFSKAQKIKDRVEKKDVLYGMFIAEAIHKKENYYFEKEDRPFDFSEMCRDGSKHYWGQNTCKPSFNKKEYRDYVEQITDKAIDMGIQVFMFGQVFYQEENIENPVYTQEIINHMKVYAQKRGVKIVIGAQTNNVENEKFLRLFDFIEGGVGLHSNGTVEDQPCFSRWWTNGQGWCWALLWDDKWKSKANNVFVHLDWSGIIGDDMSTFARMSEEKRHETLKNLHDKFNSQNIGFLMPLLTPLPKDNGGCHGPYKKFYSPNMEYGCKDLDTINEILEK